MDSAAPYRLPAASPPTPPAPASTHTTTTRITEQPPRARGPATPQGRQPPHTRTPPTHPPRRPEPGTTHPAPLTRESKNHHTAQTGRTPPMWIHDHPAHPARGTVLPGRVVEGVGAVLDGSGWLVGGDDDAGAGGGGAGQPERGGLGGVAE